MGLGNVRKSRPASRLWVLHHADLLHISKVSLALLLKYSTEVYKVSVRKMGDKIHNKENRPRDLQGKFKTLRGKYFWRKYYSYLWVPKLSKTLQAGGNSKNKSGKPLYVLFSIPKLDAGSAFQFPTSLAIHARHM